MKTNKYIYAIIALCLSVMACDPIEEEYALGEVVSKDDLKFSIAPSSENPNKIVLTSQTPDVIPRWITPLGTSDRVTDVVPLPFPGTYNFVYGALCAGGYVESDTFSLEVTTIDEDYVSGEMWTNLAGGYDKSKTWLLDFDADGVSKYFNGPLFFSSDSYDWNGACLDAGTCWIWDPAVAGNEWIASPGDYGTMTFSLIGSPGVTVNHKMTPGRGTEIGTYFLDEDAKILKLTNVAPLQNSWAGGNIDNWSIGHLVYLTEDAMQIAYKDKAKDEFLIFNYISQEYYNNN